MLQQKYSSCLNSNIFQFPFPRPVWFVHEGNTLYLLPNYGSDTNWFKNLQVGPTLKISVNGEEIPARGKLITDTNRIDYIVGRFKSRYGELKKYYPKVDVAIEVQLYRSSQEPT